MWGLKLPPQWKMNWSNRLGYFDPIRATPIDLTCLLTVSQANGWANGRTNLADVPADYQTGGDTRRMQNWRRCPPNANLTDVRAAGKKQRARQNSD